MKWKLLGLKALNAFLTVITLGAAQLQTKVKAAILKEQDKEKQPI